MSSTGAGYGSIRDWIPKKKRFALLERTHSDVKFQTISLTSKMASQTSIAIHAKVMTTMAPIMTPRIIVPTTRLKAPADEIGGV